MIKREPPFSPVEEFFFKLLLVVTFPIWGPIVIGAVIWHLYLAMKVLIAIQTRPTDWLTWHDVKRLTGRSTSQVLSILTILAGNEDPFLLCRMRDERCVNRISRRWHWPIPKQEIPILSGQATFFEFRLKHRKNGRRPKLSDMYMFAPKQPEYQST